MRMENEIAREYGVCVCVCMVCTRRQSDGKTSENVHYIKPTMTAKHLKYYNARWLCVRASVCVEMCACSNLLISINWSANSSKACVIRRIKYVCVCASTRSLQKLKLNLWSSASWCLSYVCVCKIWKMQPKREFRAPHVPSSRSSSHMESEGKNKWIANTLLALSLSFVECGIDGSKNLLRLANFFVLYQNTHTVLPLASCLPPRSLARARARALSLSLSLSLFAQACFKTQQILHLLYIKNYKFHFITVVIITFRWSWQAIQSLNTSTYI